MGINFPLSSQNHWIIKVEKDLHYQRTDKTLFCIYSSIINRWIQNVAYYKNGLAMNHWLSSTTLQGCIHHRSDSGQEKCSGTAARQLNYTHQCWWHRPWANPHVYGGYSTFQLLKWYKPMTSKPLLWYDSIQIYSNITYSVCTKLEKYRIYSKSPSPDLLKGLCPKIKFWNNSTGNHTHFRIALTESIYLHPRTGIKLL